MPTPRGFQFTERPGLYTLSFRGEPVLRIVNEHAVFRTARLNHLKLRPGGPVEFVELLPSALYSQALLAFAVTARQHSPNDLELTLTPAKVDRELTRLASETRRIRVRYLPAKRRFRWDFAVDLAFHADLLGGEGLHHTPMKQWPGDDYAVIEFDDPLFSGGLGPQVPMTQDWQGVVEPQLGEHNFTTAWQKRYHGVVFQTVERGWRNLAFNRIVNGVQQFYNRTLVKLAPRSPLYYQRTDGGWLVCTPLFDHPMSHHICEWGYDMHWYALLPKAGDGRLFRRGQREMLAWRVEEIAAAEAPAVCRSAPAAEIEDDERVAADRPIYEEPACRFTRSTLDCPDSYGWEMSDAEVCLWKKRGGHDRGSGALAFAPRAGGVPAEWRFRHLGASYAANPIPPGSRFHVAAWVRAAHPDTFTLELRLVHFQGPAQFSPRQTVTFTHGPEALRREKDGWLRLEFDAGPAPSYALVGEVIARYGGRGAACFSDLSVTRL